MRSKGYSTWYVCLSVCLQLFWYYRLRGDLWTIPMASELWECEKQKGDFPKKDFVQEICCENSEKGNMDNQHWLTSTKFSLFSGLWRYEVTQHCSIRYPLIPLAFVRARSWLCFRDDLCTIEKIIRKRELVREIVWSQQLERCGTRPFKSPKDHSPECEFLNKDESCWRTCWLFQYIINTIYLP